MREFPPTFLAGGAHADASGDRDGVRRRRRAVRPDLQRRQVQRRRGQDQLLIRRLQVARVRFVSFGRISSLVLITRVNGGRAVLAQARYFFQQLICGVSYCHFMVRTKKKRSILFSLSQQEELVHHFVLTKKSVRCEIRRGFAANLPSRPEAGEHAAGRQPGAPPQDLRLRLLQGAVLSLLIGGFLPKKKGTSFSVKRRPLFSPFLAHLEMLLRLKSLGYFSPE